MRTDETDNKPTLPSHRDPAHLGPQPTERHPTIRAITRSVNRVVVTYSPVPLDYRVLYPVCQTDDTGGLDPWCDDHARKELTYRSEVFIVSATPC
jgi:hypothetical protein